MGRLIIIVLVVAAVAGAIYYSGQGTQAPAAGGGGAAGSEKDLYAAGNAQWMNSNYDSAIATYRKALSEHPIDGRAAEARFRIGDSLEKIDKPSEALAAYKEFVAAFPDDARVAKAKTRIEFLSNTGER